MLDNELQSSAPPPATIPISPPPEMDEEEIFSVRSLHEMFVRHIWGFTSVATVVFLLGVAFIYKDPPVYQANAQVKVEEKKQVFTIQEFMDFENVTSDFYKTQVELLKSRELCRAVIEMLELGNLEEFLEPDSPPFVHLFRRPSSQDDSRLAKIVQSATEVIRQKLNLPNKALSGMDISPLVTALVDVYQKRLTVESNRKTPQLIDVHFRSHSPFVAATVANIHTQAYILQSSRSNSAYTEDYVRSIQTQIDETNRQIQAESERIVQYKKDHNLFEIGDPSQDRTIQDIDDRLTRLRESLAATSDERRKSQAEYEAIYEKGQVGDPEALLEDALDSPLLQTLITRRADAEQNWILIQTKYLENHPKYRAAQDQLNALDAQVEAERRAIVERLETKYRETSQREAELTTQEQELIREKYVRETEIEDINQMERSRQSLISKYEKLMEDLQNAQASIEAREDAGERTFEIIDQAEMPLKPINRNLLASMLMTLAAALGAGLCTVLFLEYQDDTIRTPAEVERYTGIPMIGCIPDYDYPPEMESLRPPEEGKLSSPTPESFVALRTAVLFSAMQVPSQVILITSSLPDEGKTTVAVNLAFALARSGKKTAVVDCDLRTPRLHTLFGEFREPGFVDILFQTADAKEVLRETEVPNAFLVSAGAKVDRPADLLASDMTVRALEELRACCDFVLLDGSPILVVPDASILAAHCDRNIIVVNCGRVSRDAVNSAIDHIRAAGGDVSGIVLNRVPKRERRAYRQYGYGYNYGGAEAYGEPSESTA